MHAEPRSLEHCRKLILEWAHEFKKVDNVSLFIHKRHDMCDYV